MKLLKQECKFIGETPFNFTPLINHIELAGRTCYKSYDKINPIEGTGLEFVTKIVNRRHLSVIEHSNFVLVSRDTPSNPSELKSIVLALIDWKFINVVIDKGKVFIGGNYRAFMERFNIPDLKSLHYNWKEYMPLLASEFRKADPEEIPTDLRRVSAKFITDRAVLAEFTRHRDEIVFSVESQRYCSYLEHLLLIIPHHYLDKYDMFIDGTLPEECNERVWLEHMLSVEKTYQFLKKDVNPIDKIPDFYRKEKAEEARSVLPNSTAVEMFVTASIHEWKIIFGLRLAAAAYKQIRILLSPLKQEFVKREWI